MRTHITRDKSSSTSDKVRDSSGGDKVRGSSGCSRDSKGIVRDKNIVRDSRSCGRVSKGKIRGRGSFSRIRDSKGKVRSNFRGDRDSFRNISRCRVRDTFRKGYN